MDDVETRNILPPHDSNSDPAAIQPIVRIQSPLSRLATSILTKATAPRKINVVITVEPGMGLTSIL
jgi:hypothetical protein